MNLLAMREIPDKKGFSPQDTLVIFGEVFKGGYVSGLIQQAQKIGMKIIYSTVGRRDGPTGPLRKARLEELYWPVPTGQGAVPNHKNLFIDVPLEAGFDKEPASSGKTPVDLCQEIKLSDWEKACLDPDVLASAQKKARRAFENRVREWLKQLEQIISKEGHILIAHTMAGGVPRAKIFMPILNRVLKGRGQRFFPSKDFWQTDLGKLCETNFNEVTAKTFSTLIDLSSDLRDKLKKQNRSLFYTAYSYHGTEVLMGNSYVWQTYSPYLQGFAKIKLENMSRDCFAKGVKVCVFNVPEILTRSSAVFPGVEIPLYTLLGSLKKDGGKKGQEAAALLLKKLNSGALSFLMEKTKEYFESPAVQANSDFEQWPQHNSLSQMEQMLDLSKTLSGLHKEGEESITPCLSEMVLNSTGRLILQEMAEPSQPVCWLNHDIIACDLHCD